MHYVTSLDTRFYLRALSRMVLSAVAYDIPSLLYSIGYIPIVPVFDGISLFIYVIVYSPSLVVHPPTRLTILGCGCGYRLANISNSSNSSFSSENVPPP
jgi:hypothetical protein